MFWFAWVDSHALDRCACRTSSHTGRPQAHSPRTLSPPLSHPSLFIFVVSIHLATMGATTSSTPKESLVDCSKCYVKNDAYGGAGAFATVDIAKGDEVIRERECEREEDTTQTARGWREWCGVWPALEPLTPACLRACVPVCGMCAPPRMRARFCA